MADSKNSRNQLHKSSDRFAAAAKDPEQARGSAKRTRRTDRSKQPRREQTRRTDRNSRARKIRVLKMRIIAACVIAVAVVFWYCMVAASWRGHFLPHTTVNGFDVSGLSASEAENILKQSVEGYTLTLTFRGGSSAAVSGDDIGLTYVPSGEVSALIDDQNRLTWLARKLGKKADETVRTGFRFDQNALRTFFESLPAFRNGKQPVSAQISLSSSGTFEIIPEEEGDALIEDNALRHIVSAIDSGVRQMNLDSYDDTYKTPDARSDDADLVTHCEELNAFSQRTFTVKCKDNRTETVGPAELSSWVTHDEELHTWTIDEDSVYDSVYAFIRKIADRDNDVRTTMEFETTSLGTVTEPCSEYGYKIDIGDNAKALYTAMKENSSDPVEIVNSIDEDPPDVTKTYVEIDITNQVLYIYKNGKLFYRTKVVTGLESDPGRRTPSGIFDLQGKAQDRILGTLTAVDPSARYESHVDYWMPFYYSYGMHDASWRDINSFGGDVYLEHGSHGCVNLPPASAKIVFNNVETGTAVAVVRKGDDAEDGTELGDAKWNPPEGGLRYSE